MLPTTIKGMTNMSSLRVGGMRTAGRTSQRSSVIVCVRKKFMEDSRWGDDGNERFNSRRSRSATSTRVRDRFADEEEEAPVVQRNGIRAAMEEMSPSRHNGNGVRAAIEEISPARRNGVRAALGDTTSPARRNGVRAAFEDNSSPTSRNGVRASLSDNSSPTKRNGVNTSPTKRNGVRAALEAVPPPPSPATRRSRPPSPSRFESGMERPVAEPAPTSSTTNITERFMSRARSTKPQPPAQTPAEPAPQPATTRPAEPTPSFRAAERARSPDPMRAPRSFSRTASRGRVRDRFQDDSPSASPSPSSAPSPPVVKPITNYAPPERATTSRTPSPIRRKRLGPTAQRLALISKEQAAKPTPASSFFATSEPDYIDVEAFPTKEPWGLPFPVLGKGIPFFDIMAFNGSGPETINGRLAMIGFFSMLCTEFATGETLVEQWVYTMDSLPYMFAIWTVASVVPLLRGVNPEKNEWGPFTPTAEKWNGRGAMIGILGVIVMEALKGRALFF